MGIAFGTEHVAQGGLYIANEQVGQLWIGMEKAYDRRAFRPLGTFFAFDDGDQLHTWPAGDIADQTIVGTYVNIFGVIRSAYGATSIDQLIYAVSRDLLINPVQVRLHRFALDGGTVQVGVFPAGGTFPVIAPSTIAYAESIDSFYMIEPRGHPVTQSRIWRFRASDAVVEGSTSRLIFPEDTAPLLTTSAGDAGGSAAVVDGQVYWTSGQRMYRFPANLNALAAGDIADLGLLPVAIGSVRGMAPIGSTYIAMMDDNNRLWYANVLRFHEAVQEGSVTGLSGDIGSMAFVVPPAARILFIGANNLLLGANQLTIGA